MSSTIEDKQKQLNYITTLINEYIKLNDEIKALKQSIKERQHKQKLAEESIIAYMENEANVDYINLDNTNQIIKPIEQTRTKGASFKKFYEIVKDKLKDNTKLLEQIDAELKKHEQQVTSQAIKIAKANKVSKLKKQSKETDELLQIK